MQFRARKAAEISRMTPHQAFPREPHDAVIVQLGIVAKKMFPSLVGQEHAAAQDVANDGFAGPEYDGRGSGGVPRGENDAPFDAMGFERKSIAKQQIGFKRLEGFVHERTDEPGKRGRGDKQPVFSVAHQFGVSGVEGDLHSAASF